MATPEDVEPFTTVEFRPILLKVGEKEFIFSTEDLGSVIAGLQLACRVMDKEAPASAQYAVMRSVLRRLSVIDERFDAPPRGGRAF